MADEPKRRDSASAGVQGWLFERPPQTPECEVMKPPRRLGKGLAALVDLHGGSLGEPGSDDKNEPLGSSVLQLLSTTAEELADSKQAAADAAALAAATRAEAPGEAPEPVIAVPVIAEPVVAVPAAVPVAEVALVGEPDLAAEPDLVVENGPAAGTELPGTELPGTDLAATESDGGEDDDDDESSFSNSEDETGPVAVPPPAAVPAPTNAPAPAMEPAGADDETSDVAFVAVAFEPTVTYQTTGQFGASGIFENACAPKPTERFEPGVTYESTPEPVADAPLAEPPVADTLVGPDTREPAPAIVEAVVEPEPEPAGFEDEWFDPPLASFSAAAGFQRVSAQHSAPAPDPIPEPAPAAIPAPASRLPAEPAPAPMTVTAAQVNVPPPSRLPDTAPPPAPVLDDPLVQEHAFFDDDIVVGSFLPEVDLDS